MNLHRQLWSDVPPAVPILGIPVAQVTYADVLEQISRWVDQPDGPAHSIVAANVHVVTEGAMRLDFRDCLLDADLIVPDGMPLVWASMIQGGQLNARCYGPALMIKTLEAFPRERCGHYLYGSTEDTLQKLAATIQQRWPKTGVLGMKSPDFGPLNDEVELANIEEINASGARIVWVAMGCPKQEIWMHRYRQRLKAGVVLAVGAAFDFIAGSKPEAPLWMQHLGLEWVFRIYAEPARLWKRYVFRNPYFVAQFLLQVTGLRWRSPTPRGAHPPRHARPRGEAGA